MGKSRFQGIAAVMGLVLCLGCGTYGTNTVVSYLYYFYGPEDTLEVLETSVILPENQALADLERAMVLLELGRYEDSLTALASADKRLRAEAAASVVSGPRSKRPPWRPDYHERVLISTLAMADSLALYDVQAAAAAADRVLGTIAEIDCESCDFDFSRVLAALSYGSVGRFLDGVDALADVVLTGRAGDLVDELRRRLDAGLSGVQPEGFAPPPVASERFVVAILLLGRGPYKDPDKLAVGADETIGWFRYLPRGPQAVTWAAMDLEDPAISVEFTDVEALADAGLDLKAQRVIDGEISPVDPKYRDLRHWASLPASLQLLVVDLPDGVDFTDLVYYSPEGYEVDRETIEVPDSWIGGPIFVTRRMP